MIKFDVNNRFSGKVQFTAEIGCKESHSRAWKLRLAVLWAISHKIDLSGSDLRGSNLSGSDLRGSNLSGSDLSGSDLSGSDLRGDKVGRLIATASRSDGYVFYAFTLEAGGWKVLAGCRWFSEAEYRAHILREYASTAKAIEAGDILDFLAKRAGR